MTGDPVALGLLAFLTLLFLSLVPAFVGAVFATKGLGFQPLPVWPLNVVLPLLGLFALWSGFGQGHWFTLGFLGLATESWPSSTCCPSVGSMARSTAFGTVPWRSSPSILRGARPFWSLPSATSSRFLPFPGTKPCWPRSPLLIEKIGDSLQNEGFLAKWLNKMLI